jgi:MerR family transcriptional regulator, thiopeptide resistance regulator
MLKIGDVAKKTGISIRSLRHYDEICLLKPSGHSESGYRLYAKADILRLQQIVSLKQMGFSLKKIQTMLHEDAMSLQQTLEIQLQSLRRDLLQQQRVCQQVAQVHAMLQQRKDVSLDVVFTTMESIKMLEKYHTKDQIEELNNRFKDADEGQLYGEAWLVVFNGLAQLQAKSVPASDNQTKPFVEKAHELVGIYTGGDKDIEKGLFAMYSQEGGASLLRSYGMDVSDELYAYYEQAWAAHLEN